MTRKHAKRDEPWFPPHDLADATAYRFWKCQKCDAECALLYHHGERFCARLPDWFECPACGRQLPGPWPPADFVHWRCRICGHQQHQLKSHVKSGELQMPIIDGPYTFGLYGPTCERCAERNQPLPLSSLSYWKRLEAGFLGGVEWGAEPDERAAGRRLRAEGERSLQAELHRLAQIKRAYDAEQRRFERAMTSLDELRALTPRKFEDVVAALFSAMGWGVYWTRASGDHGIDLVLEKRNTRAAVQCKKHRRDIGEPAVRAFYGAFAGKLKEGYFVITSDFTAAARGWANPLKPLHLISGLELVELMEKYDPEMLDERPMWYSR